MRTTPELLDALKTKTGAASDYALAKILGVTRGAVSIWRTGTGTFSDEMALKVASILEIEPGLVLTICYSERAKTEAEKNAWRTMWEKLGGVAATVAIGIMLNSAYPTESRASTGELVRLGLDNNIHYTKYYEELKIVVVVKIEPQLHYGRIHQFDHSPACNDAVAA